MRDSRVVQAAKSIVKSPVGLPLPGLPPAGLRSMCRWPKPSLGRKERNEVSWKELRDEKIPKKSTASHSA